MPLYGREAGRGGIEVHMPGSLIHIIRKDANMFSILGNSYCGVDIIAQELRGDPRKRDVTKGLLCQECLDAARDHGEIFKAEKTRPPLDIHVGQVWAARVGDRTEKREIIKIENGELTYRTPSAGTEHKLWPNQFKGWVWRTDAWLA